MPSIKQLIILRSLALSIYTQSSLLIGAITNAALGVQTDKFKLKAAVLSAIDSAEALLDDLRNQITTFIP
jgi:hypothetical protein